MACRRRIATGHQGSNASIAIEEIKGLPKLADIGVESQVDCLASPELCYLARLDRCPDAPRSESRSASFSSALRCPRRAVFSNGVSLSGRLAATHSVLQDMRFSSLMG